MFQKKNVLYEDHTANNSATKQFLYATIVTSLIYLLFVTFSLVFPKLLCSSTKANLLENNSLLFFLSSVFISKFGFYQTFCLNSMTLCAFFNTNL